MLIDIVERATGRNHLEALYDEALKKHEQGIPFWDAALSTLSIGIEIEEEQRLESLPSAGPLLVIGNHPFGIVDGLITCKIAARTRNHFQVLINEVLCTEETIRHYFLPIDFRGTGEASRRNVESRREALRLLEKGEAIVLFPGGGVATRRGGIGKLEELPWGTFLAKIISEVRPTVLPLYYYGQNSLPFHLASQVHLALRQSMYVYETRRLMSKSVRVKIQPPVMPEEMDGLKSKQEIVQFLFKRTLGVL